MSLTPADQKRIIEKESAWTDPAFGGIDLTAFPALNELPPEQVHDNRFSKDWRDTALSSSATALREFVSSPDNETLQRIGQETGNSEYLREVRDRKAEDIAQRFKQQCPGYLPTADNYSVMIETLAFNALKPADQEGSIEEQVALLTDLGYFTVPNLIATFNALSAEGLLDVPLGSTRELSTAERLRVTRMAQSGRADAAIGEYLRCSLDGEEPSMKLLDDPDYRQACDQAVWFVFENITNDYVPSAEREAYIQRHCAGRPITLALLQSAWSACQVNEQRHHRGELLDQYQRPEDAHPPSERELNSLSDAEVDRLYHGALKEYVNSFRHGTGVLA
jgi:hypothetical protein